MGKPNISKILAKSKDIYDDIMIQLLESEEVGMLVRLHFAPTWTPSTSTHYEDWGGASINGTPDVSAEVGEKQTDVTTEVRMRVYSTDAQGFGRSLYKFLGGAKYTNGELLTIGYMKDYGKVADSVKADFYLETESITGLKTYKVIGDIRPHGFAKDKFFFCFWEKVQ